MQRNQPALTRTGEAPHFKRDYFMHRRHILQLGLLGTTLSMTTVSARAQAAFPSRPLRLVVPFPPGGPTDIFARQYAIRLAGVLGQAVIVDNKSGASGAIGSMAVKNADPDGLVLLFGTASTHGLYNLITSQPQYDSLQDFTHIAIVGGAPAAFGVGPDGPQTLKGVVEMARANPGRVQYGSPGEGTYLHLVGERFKRDAGKLDIQHIPFRGSAQAIPALIGGQVGMTVDTLGSLLPNHKAGKLRIVAVASPNRSPLAADVPTVNEALGMRGFEASLWNVLSGPALLPANVIATLAAANLKVMNDPSLHQQLAALSIEPVTDSNPAKARSYISAEMEKWRPVVSATGLKLQ